MASHKTKFGTCGLCRKTGEDMRPSTGVRHAAEGIVYCIDEAACFERYYANWQNAPE